MKSQLAKWSMIVSFVAMTGALALAHHAGGAWRWALVWASGFSGALCLLSWAVSSHAKEHGG